MAAQGTQLYRLLVPPCCSKSPGSRSLLPFIRRTSSDTPPPTLLHLHTAQFLNSAISTIIANAHLPGLSKLIVGTRVQNLFFQVGATAGPDAPDRWGCPREFELAQDGHYPLQTAPLATSLPARPPPASIDHGSVTLSDHFLTCGQGIYTDLTPNWYKNVGMSIVTSQFVATAVRLVNVTARWLTLKWRVWHRAGCLTQVGCRLVEWPCRWAIMLGNCWFFQRFEVHSGSHC